MKKRIAKIEVVKAGSSPDIDSDFHTKYREEAINYVSDLYGKGNVASIVTFGTMAAKGAWKALCKIYEVPFKEAHKVSQLIPDAVEGKEITLAEIFDEKSSRYEDAHDFREAVSSSEWKKIIEGALKVEGKNQQLGVHACGIVISSTPLIETIPLHVRQSDEKLITQWVYQDCEEIGLIKMDMLGLDTVDIIQSTVKNIIDNGKEPPVLSELIHGELDDKKVYDTFAQGNTVGIFQFGSEMVRDLLLRMKPTEFNDLVATTAIARPGPMGMKSHEKYADRKNGREKIDYIHEDFKDSPIVDILKETYGLVIYQESVTKIANVISGMTLQEGDDLRKAMGKKKVDVMMKLKPKFISGGINNGFSEEAMTTLWETLEPFSLYAFNKSHSVAYALTAYQCAYLKTYYPAEFMAALVSQHISKRDKVLLYLSEMKKMGIDVVSPNINKSGVSIVSEKGKENRVSFGLGGIKGVGDSNAKGIIDEREKNGQFTSLRDFIKRTNVDKRALVSLIDSGACDEFHENRSAMKEFALKESIQVKKDAPKGDDLFDMFDMNEDFEVFDDIKEIFSERVKNEAETIGFYLAQHPLDKIPNIPGNNLASVKKSFGKVSYVYASCVSLISKKGRGKVSYKLLIEDKTDSIVAYAPKNVVARWDKARAQNQILKALESDNAEINDETLGKALDITTWKQDIVEKHTVYLFKISANNYGVQILDIYPVELSENGTLASQIVIPVSPKKDMRDKQLEFYKDKLKEVELSYPGDNLLHVCFVPNFEKAGRESDFVLPPINIYDRFLIGKLQQQGYLTKEKAQKLVKDILTSNPHKDLNPEKTKESTLRNIHCFYPPGNFSIHIDSSHDKIVYDLENLVGNGNYHLR